MVRLIAYLISTFLISLAGANAYADILFEGYSKVTSEQKHIGFTISRYEFDAKKNHFISTYFTKIAVGRNEVTESLKAVADSELNPISYEYTQVAGSNTKTIDAKFNGLKFSGIITENGSTKKINKNIEKGTFLSTFLVYLMLKSKTGLQSDTTYEYKAIAEEDGEIVSGKAVVGKLETFNGTSTYKILNTFKDASFVSFVSERGEVLGTQADSHGIHTQLVAKPSEATQDFKISESVMKSLFGDSPKGLTNVLSKRSSESLKSSEPMVIKKSDNQKTGK